MAILVVDREHVKAGNFVHLMYCANKVLNDPYLVVAIAVIVTQDIFAITSILKWNIVHCI